MGRTLSFLPGAGVMTATRFTCLSAMLLVRGVGLGSGRNVSVCIK